MGTTQNSGVLEDYVEERRNVKANVLVSDVVGVCLSFLDVRDLNGCCLVSKEWYELSWSRPTFENFKEVTLRKDSKLPPYFEKFVHIEKFLGRDQENETTIVKELDRIFDLDLFQKIDTFHFVLANVVPSRLGNCQSITKLCLSLYKGIFLNFEIERLVHLQEFTIYGSNVISIPPGIGKCTKLTRFSPYTSYDLHYLPYEIRKCPISFFTMSRRAVWGGRSVSPNPPDDLSVIQTERRKVCSVCENKFKNNVRIRKLTEGRLKADKMAYLCVVCSEDCKSKLCDLTLSRF